jgi:hypothetical protein
MARPVSSERLSPEQWRFVRTRFAWAKYLTLFRMRFKLLCALERTNDPCEILRIICGVPITFLRARLNDVIGY